MDKHLGVQQRWSKAKLRQVRKMSDVDVEKYDRWVVLDDDVSTPQYKNEYRGNVQNRKVDIELMPMFAISYYPYKNGIKEYNLTDNNIDAFNVSNKPLSVFYLSCHQAKLDAKESKKLFALIDTLSARISSTHIIDKACDYLLQRAVAQSVVHDYNDAINDLSDYVAIDSTSMLGYWQRGVCQALMMSYTSGVGNMDNQIILHKAIEDFKKALELDADNSIILYNLGSLYASVNDYAQAIPYYNRAIQQNASFAEAYYNRGLTRIFDNDKEGGLSDLSKAGELGLYNAYAVMKHFQENK
jgi:tetratricopeptide (TPR) repeat protein